MKKYFKISLAIFALLFLVLSCDSEPEHFTVSFDSNGGSKVESIVVESGKTVTQPDNPTKPGFDFICWELDGKVFDFSTPITGDITLTAKWEKQAEEIKKYIVTFNSNGGTPVQAVVVENGKTVAKPENPTRDGYSFVCWELNGEEFDFSTPIVSDIVLDAEWKENCKHENVSEEYILENDILYKQTICDSCNEQISKKQLEDGTYFIVTTENVDSLSFSSNMLYYFTAGEYGDRGTVTGDVNTAFFTKEAENISFVAEDGVVFDDLTIGYHSGQDTALPARENSSLTIKGFTVNGTLNVASIDNKVVIEANKCKGIVVSTWKTNNMKININKNIISGSEGRTNKYCLFIIPNATDYDLTITNNSLQGSVGHCICVQGGGDGGTPTTANSLNISGNTFGDFGLLGTKRAAFKIWADSKWAATSKAPLTADAISLMENFIVDNTFECEIDGTKLVYGDFYGTTYMPK